MTDLDKIFEETLPDDHRSGIIAVVGRPNVGKSTLINRILGQKIAIVSPKPQTTRRQQLGIYTTENSQILFVDTPGLHKPQHKLGEFMVKVAEDALRDSDLVLWVLDVSVEPQEADKHIAETLKRLYIKNPIILVLNKTDLLNEKARELHLDQYRGLVDSFASIMVSALDGSGVQDMLQFLFENLPLGPRYYPADQVSEVNMRFVASEVVREKIILNTEQEIPYSVAVEVTEYKERSQDMTYISATIYVERESQKGILIGKNGEMIKRVGAEARTDLTAMLETQVYLELHVKVLKNWRSDEALMYRLGYRLPKNET